MNSQREAVQEKDRAMGVYEEYPRITLPSTANIAKPGKGIDLQVSCMLRDMGQVTGRPWRMEARAALMKAADFPGCPQSIIARFTQELSHFLQANPQVRTLQELCKNIDCFENEHKIDQHVHNAAAGCANLGIYS